MSIVICLYNIKSIIYKKVIKQFNFKLYIKFNFKYLHFNKNFNSGREHNALSPLSNFHVEFKNFFKKKCNVHRRIDKGQDYIPFFLFRHRQLNFRKTTFNYSSQTSKQILRGKVNSLFLYLSILSLFILIRVWG